VDRTKFIPCGWDSAVKLLVILFVLFGFQSHISAQSGFGELTGIVTDASNSAVGGATVNLVNSATGEAHHVVTNSVGVYRFTTLPIVGRYTLTITANGFQTFEAKNIALTVGNVTTQNAALNVGNVQQTVVVQGAQEEQVQTDTAAVSQLIDSQIWKNSPLETRSQNAFVTLVAGATPDNAGVSVGTGRGAAMNGARTGAGNFMVDGLDNNDQGLGGGGAVGGGGAITTISPDAIQEYRVITHDPGADYGRAGGFATDTVMKSGTNTWHGSLFEYNRIQALAANDFFSNREGLKDSLVRNQFGGSIGGPIYKDKTFFYSTIEIHHRRQGTPVTGVSLTPDFLSFVDSGRFASFMESDPNGICVQFGGAPCPGAFAGSTKLGPIFKQLMAAEPTAFPLATTNPTNQASGIVTSGITYPVAINAFVAITSHDALNQNRGTFKLDHKLTDNDQLSFVYLIDQYEDDSNTGGGCCSFGPGVSNDGGAQHFGATWTHSFSPSLINVFRAGYLRHVSNFLAPGTTGVPSIYTADALYGGFGAYSGFPQLFTENQFQYQDSITKNLGAHTLKSGFQYIRTRNGSSFYNDNYGTVIMNGAEDLLTDGAFGEETDAAIFGGPTYGSFYQVSAAIDPTTNQAPDPYRGYRANEFAAYVQDDWKASKRLTLNMGIRWEYFGPPHNFKSGVDSNVYFGPAGTPTSNGNPYFPTTSFFGEVQGAQFIQKDSDIWNKDTNNFAPRVGFAYDVTGQGKLVVRGGYGIGFDRLYNNAYENIRFNPPHFADNNFGALVNGVAAGPTYQPGIYSVPFTANAQLASFGAKPTPRHIDEHLVTAYYQQIHLGFEYQVAPGYILETNYIGTLGRKLIGLKDINNYNGRTACSGSELQPACIADGYPNGFPSTRITSLFNADNYRSNGFSSNYNALQVSLRKGYSNGLQFLANYTYSKALDELSDVFSQRDGNTGPTDLLNPSKDYGPADFDLKHNFVMTLNYTEPWRQKNFLLGGWSFAPIIRIHNGTPIALTDSAHDPNRDGRLVDRPQFVGTGSLKSAITHKTSPADGYLNPASFAPVGTFDSAINQYICTNGALWCDSPLTRNALNGPGYVNVDFGVLKHINITERQTFTFEANFFNLFNHANFNNPDGNIASGTFGQSLSDSGPRVTQLALRYDF
jgi:hypothetical protein